MVNVRRRSQHLVTSACLALAVAACGSAQGGSPGPVSPTSASVADAATAHPVTPTPAISSAGSPNPTTQASPPPALTMLWEGSGPTQPTPCCETWWPAIDPKSGNVWVTNSFADEFWIFKPDGTFVEAWGKSGTSDGEFDFDLHRPNVQAGGGIAFAPDGSFYIADSGNHRVQAFTADRHHVTTWGSFGSGDGQFATPVGIVTDGTTVYVADDDRGDIQAFDHTGKYLRTFGSVDVDAGIFIALGPDGSLYRAGPGDNEVSKYDPQGNLLSTVRLQFDDAFGGGYTVGPAVAPNGHLFVNVGSALGAVPPTRLIELDENGQQLHLWSTGGESGVVAPTGDAIYLGNGSPSWPTASLRKYELPTH